MFETTKALVLREVKYKEADRILTLFTADNGKITAKARGALRKSSKTGAATQLLTYADMTLFFNKGKWTVNEASVIESFDGLKTDIERFALGSYFAECAEALSVEDQKDGELLSLVLNSLYALSRGMYDARKIKAAFELRLMSLSGSSGILPVTVDTLPNAKKFIRLGEGTMVHDMNGFTVRGTDVDGDPFEIAANSTTFIRRRMCSIAVTIPGTASAG